MKPPPLEYHAATSVDDAVSVLGSIEGAKVLAGGQSLVPLLNFRLARPSLLIDIHDVAGLKHIYARNGGVAIGAAVTQREAERSELVGQTCPLLPLGLGLVAHIAIRNRGTVCGSIAHADPASELCAILLAVGGHVVARSTAGTRVIHAGQLYSGPLETTLRPDELIEEAWFPATRGRVAIEEESRRYGDYAMAGVVVAGDRLALFGVAGTPVLADANDPLKGISPSADLESSSEFKLHLIEVLVRRAAA